MHRQDLPPPPIPQRLHEMLAEYPGHIKRLQQALDRFASTPSGSVGPIEHAIWTIEGRLESFFLEARRELEDVKAIGDAEEIAIAERKMDVMSGAMHKIVWIGDKALWSYIDQYKDVLL